MPISRVREPGQLRKMIKRVDLLWPTLKALESLGGSASPAEIVQRIGVNMALPDSMLDIPHRNGPQSEVAYRAAWARTDLKHIGAVVNSAHGVWTITRFGRNVDSDESVRELVRRKAKKLADRAKKPTKTDPDGSPPANGNDVEGNDWKEQLLQVIRQVKPDAFERLCQRLLREAGFLRVEVTGRSGDGGIDGGGVLRLNLLSFHVEFQCKRYSGSVGAREIRDFRGGLVGRADKGLFITTGRFTASAAREALRDGAMAIDLVDGDYLCDLLKKYGLGTSIETVEQIQIDEEFFRGI